MIRLLFELVGRIRERAPGIGVPRVTLLTLAILWYAASGFLYFELEGQPDLSWIDAFWWAFVTMTTVGYGDLFPKSPGGRYLIGIPTMIVGISILGYLLSMVASFLVERRNRELKGLGTVTLTDHLLIVHYPGLLRVREVVDEYRADLKSKDRGVVLVDQDLEELPAELEARGVRFVRGDPTLEPTLHNASAGTASQAIILSRRPGDRTSDHASLAVTLTLEKLWPDLHTVAECVDAAHVPLLERCGCDSVVCLDQLSSRLLVQEALDPGVQALVHELTSNTYGQQLYAVKATGSTWAECRGALEGTGALAVGLRRAGTLMVNPAPGDAVSPGDEALVIARSRPG